MECKNECIKKIDKVKCEFTLRYDGTPEKVTSASANKKNLSHILSEGSALGSHFLTVLKTAKNNTK